MDDSLYDKVRSNLVGLMMRNHSLLAENEQMMKRLKDWECDKKKLARVKEKNVALKMEVKACHNRERSVIWAVLLLVVIITAGYVVGAGGRM